MKRMDETQKGAALLAIHIARENPDMDPRKALLLAAEVAEEMGKGAKCADSDLAQACRRFDTAEKLLSESYVRATVAAHCITPGCIRFGEYAIVID